MEIERTIISYVHGNKGSLGTRIFFKGVIYSLVFQMVFFGVTIPTPAYIANLPQSVLDLKDSLDVPDIQAAAITEAQSRWVTESGGSSTQLPLVGWGEYDSKDSGLQVGEDLRLTSELYTMTQTSNDGVSDTCEVPGCSTGGGFNSGTDTNIQVSRSGTEAFVELATKPVFKDFSQSFMAQVDADGDARDIALDSGYAYVVDGKNGLKIFDISNPVSPVLIGTYDAGGSFNGIEVIGDYAYVAAGVAGLIVVNVSNRSNPIHADTYNSTGSAQNIAVADNIAYLADGKKGVRMVDVTTKTNISLLGTYDTAGEAHDIAVEGNTAYVADDTTGLVVLDVSDSASPALVTTLDTGTALSVHLSGRYAYVTDLESALNVIDISVPQSPQVVANYEGGSSAGSVQVFGNYAFVPDGTSGLHILDVSNPLAPVWIGTYDDIVYGRDGQYRSCR